MDYLSTNVINYITDFLLLAILAFLEQAMLYQSLKILLGDTCSWLGYLQHLPREESSNSGLGIGLPGIIEGAVFIQKPLLSGWPLDFVNTFIVKQLRSAIYTLCMTGSHCFNSGGESFYERSTAHKA